MNMRKKVEQFVEIAERTGLGNASINISIKELKEVLQHSKAAPNFYDLRTRLAEVERNAAFMNPESIRALVGFVFDNLDRVETPRTFEQDWQPYVDAGYQYGPDALEAVKLGWTIAMMRKPT